MAISVAYHHTPAAAEVIKAMHPRGGYVNNHPDRQVGLLLGKGALCSELGLLRFEIDDLVFIDRQIGRIVYAAEVAVVV
jgi:hypothetical protein